MVGRAGDITAGQGYTVISVPGFTTPPGELCAKSAAAIPSNAADDQKCRNTIPDYVKSIISAGSKEYTWTIEKTGLKCKCDLRQ